MQKLTKGRAATLLAACGPIIYWASHYLVMLLRSSKPIAWKPDTPAATLFYLACFLLATLLQLAPLFLAAHAAQTKPVRVLLKIWGVVFFLGTILAALPLQKLPDIAPVFYYFSITNPSEDILLFYTQNAVIYCATLVLVKKHKN